MADAFRVGQLPRDVQDRIFAFADGCLSRQHRGIPRVCKFLLLDRSLPYGGLLPLAVLEEYWRLRCRSRHYMEDGAALPCQTCGCLRIRLTRVHVGFVELTLHRRITRVPPTDGAADTVSTQLDFELRDVCDMCHQVLLWADSGWRDR